MRTTFVQIGKVGEMPLSRCEALEIINNVLMLDGSSAHSTRMEYDITAGCQCYALLNWKMSRGWDHPSGQCVSLVGLAIYMTLPSEDVVAFKDKRYHCIFLDHRRSSLNLIVVNLASCFKMNFFWVKGDRKTQESVSTLTLTPESLASAFLAGSPGKTGKPTHKPRSQ